MLDLLFAVVALDQIQTVLAPKNIIYHDSTVPLRQKKWGQIFFKKNPVQNLFKVMSLICSLHFVDQKVIKSKTCHNYAIPHFLQAWILFFSTKSKDTMHMISHKLAIVTHPVRNGSNSLPILMFGCGLCYLGIHNIFACTLCLIVHIWAWLWSKQTTVYFHMNMM